MINAIASSFIQREAPPNQQRGSARWVRVPACVADPQLEYQLGDPDARFV